MKNQNDLIVAIAVVVVSLGAAAAFYFTKPTPVAPAAPTAVNLTPVKVPEGSVVMANSLPGGSGGGMTSRAGGGGSRFAGASGMAGPAAGFGGGAPRGAVPPSAASSNPGMMNLANAPKAAGG